MNKKASQENEKSIYLLAGSSKTAESLRMQIIGAFSFEELRVIALDVENDKLGNQKDFGEWAIGKKIMISSMEYREELVEKAIIPKATASEIFVCGRSLWLDDIEEVINIPKGSKVLFVNDTENTAITCIQNLMELGVDHIEYTPFFPGEILGDNEKGLYKIAITAGETHLVPKEIEEIIDLGPRGMDLETIFRLADFLEMAEFDATSVIKPYTRKIIEISKKMVIMNLETVNLKGLLRKKLEIKGHTAPHNFGDIVGFSLKLIESKEIAKKLAKTDLTVLIEGESGTGKELFASAIHNESPRRNGPFLGVNFSALPEELVESELFGYEEGAFTGAKKGGKTGLFQQADGGTIFLDEIGDISLRMQTKLLRVLQEREIMPIGSTDIKKVDIRVIGATNKNLKEMVGNGDFREDLYYRLKVGYIKVPPLRDRKEDIKPLINHLIEKELGKALVVEVSVLERFAEYSWYGNVRELYNAVRYMLAVRERENILSEKDLPEETFFEPILDRNNLVQMLSLSGEEVQLLGVVYGLRSKGKIAGRVTVSEGMAARGYDMTESQVRNRLNNLESKGLVKIQNGKRGTFVTEEGMKYIYR